MNDVSGWANEILQDRMAMMKNIFFMILDCGLVIY